MKLLSPLLLSLLFFPSCNGQVKTQSSKINVSESRTILAGQPTIIKTQGTDRYANVYCGMQDKAGNLWFGTTGEGIYRFDGKSFTNFTEKDGLSNNTVWSILEDKTGILWFGTNGGVCRFDGKNFSSFPISGDLKYSPEAYQGPVLSILLDKTGSLWFGTMYHGVYRYDGRTFANFLSDEAVECILEDKAGNIWFGSWSNGGAYCFDKSRANHPCITNSCKHGLQRRQDQTEHYEEIAKSFTNFRKQDGLADDMISDIIEDRMGNIWFGTRDHGVCRYDGKSFVYFSEKDGLGSNCITYILEDKIGNLWFGHDGKWGNDGRGVSHYDGKSFTNFTTKEGLINNNVFTIIEDKTGSLWFGSRDMGLCRYDGKSFTDFSEHVPK